MEHLAQEICDILHDYHSHKGFKFTCDIVINWVSQFDGSDQQFILEEFLHILKQGIYISQSQARKLLVQRIYELANDFKFSDPLKFLQHVEFIKMQADPKSQFVLLTIMEEELVANFGVGFGFCGSVSKKYAIYVDDIMATGNTIYQDLFKWLSLTEPDGISNFDKVVKKEKILIVSVFCTHSWVNIDWRLKVAFENDAITKKIYYYYDFEVQNHPTTPGQSLNFAYPIKDQPKIVDEYLDSLTAKFKKETAYRKPNTPLKESFYSSAENRIRFENVILIKGIQILQSGKVSHNHRPLGDITPSKQTFGTGTLFFTWRNVSNTTPIVFWWRGHWTPLFLLNNRGVKS